MSLIKSSFAYVMPITPFCPFFCLTGVCAVSGRKPKGARSHSDTIVASTAPRLIRSVALRTAPSITLGTPTAAIVVNSFVAPHIDSSAFSHRRSMYGCAMSVPRLAPTVQSSGKTRKSTSFSCARRIAFIIPSAFLSGSPGNVLGDAAASLTIFFIIVRSSRQALYRLFMSAISRA